jgi:phage replication O-like protein O
METANPATKNGYVPIANELVEQLARVNLPGNEMRIVWTLWRKTWGWKNGSRRKDWDNIPVTQFEKATGMKKANCYNSLKSLLAKSIIVKSENGYKFNQNYNEWLLAKRLNRNTVVANKLIDVSLQANKEVANKLTKVLAKSIISKEKKETIKEKNKEITPPAANAATDVQKLMGRFYETVNPNINFGDRRNRDASDWLIKHHGLGKVLAAVDYAAANASDRFCPTITTPYQMKEKMAALVKYKLSRTNQNKERRNYDE